MPAEDEIRGYDGGWRWFCRRLHLWVVRGIPISRNSCVSGRISVCFNILILSSCSSTLGPSFFCLLTTTCFRTFIHMHACLCMFVPQKVGLALRNTAGGGLVFGFFLAIGTGIRSCKYVETISRLCSYAGVPVFGHALSGSPDE